jgi:CRP-like cAMP-binding protein
VLGWLFGRRRRDGWRAAPCLAELGEKDLDRLERHVTEKRLEPGVVLVHEGDEATELFLLIEGEMDVERRGEGVAIALGRLEGGDVVGEVALFDRGPRSATARARTACTVYAVPFACLDGKRGGLSTEGRLSVLSRVGAELAAHVRAGGAASALAERRGAAMGELLVAVMTLQCIYAITLTALPYLDGLLPSSTTYVSIPLQLVFGAAGMAFILRTRLPLRTFGLGLRDLASSVLLGAIVTVPFLGVVAGLKWMVLAAKGSTLPLVEHPDLASVAGDPRVRTLFSVYAVSCLVQEIIVRSALQSSLHLFLTGKQARIRAIGVCALVFATNHLHMSPLFAAVALFPGILWGWMFARTRNIAGVTLSHIVIGAFVFFVLGIYTG